MSVHDDISDSHNDEIMYPAVDFLPEKSVKLIVDAMTLLKPYADDIILIGGLTTYFYRYHDLYERSQLSPRPTLDLDIATDTPLETRDGISVDELLKERFVAYVTTDSGGMLSELCYQLKEDGNKIRSEVCVDIFAPLRGRNAKTPVKPQPDLYAIGNRQIPMLMHGKTKIHVPWLGAVNVPNPVAFIIGKMLIRKKRRSHKAASDQYDIALTAMSFVKHFDQLKDHLESIKSIDGEHRTWCNKSLKQMAILYQSVDSQGVQEVVRSSELTHDIGQSVYETMQLFLHKMSD